MYILGGPLQAGSPGLMPFPGHYSTPSTRLFESSHYLSKTKNLYPAGMTEGHYPTRRFDSARTLVEATVTLISTQ